MQKILVIAGEASGDLHAGKVMLELKKLNPQLKIIGTGGSNLIQTGAELYYRVEDLAVIGFSEVMKVYRFIKNVFNDLVNKLDEEKPDIVFLVDYPAFNLRFAEAARKKGFKVVFYVAPQVWAWKKNRIGKIKTFVDELIVLFPFEVDFFAREGVEAHCFGHPLLDIVKPSDSRAALEEKLKLDPSKKIISILPGSRKNEMSKHLPLLLQTVDRLLSQRDDVQFVYPLAPTVDKEQILETLQGIGGSIILVENDTYNVVANSDFALVASGTATLETAILGTPFIIFYKTSLFTYLIGKYILKIKAIGLPNIISKREVVPENPHFTSPEEMTKLIQSYLNDPTALAQLKENLSQVKNNLGESGAYERTAVYIQSLLDQATE